MTKESESFPTRYIKDRGERDPELLKELRNTQEEYEKTVQKLKGRNK